MFSGKPASLKHTHDQPLDVSHLPDDFSIGMVVKNGAWRKTRVQPKPISTFEPTLKSTTVVAMRLISWSDFTGSVGDFFHHIGNLFEGAVAFIKDGVVYLKEGVSFVINKVAEGLEFVLNLADKVLRLALKTVGAVFKALNWVLKLVGIDLSKVSGVHNGLMDVMLI
jgi:hypothetical protein